MLTIKSVLWRSWLERKSSKREVVGSSPTVGESEIGYLTSHATIFQLYMLRHIDVQADWRSWTYSRASNAIDIS